MTVEHSETSRLGPVFAACRKDNRAALIGYLPTGYPDVPTSVEAMTALVESGCDIVEVGVPYSDPGMDDCTFSQRNNSEYGSGVEQQHRRGRGQPRGIGLMRGGGGQDDAVGAHDSGQDDQNAEQAGWHHRLRSPSRRTMAARNSGIPAPVRDDVTTSSGKAAGCLARAA